VQHRLNRVADELKIPRFSHHDLRRTQQTWPHEQAWGEAVCLAIAGQNNGATVLRNHDWRPNHRRMTLPAFQDVAGIFREAGILKGDPVGDTEGTRSRAKRRKNAESILT
jgi:hypothetical protein